MCIMRVKGQVTNFICFMWVMTMCVEVLCRIVALRECVVVIIH